jgi:hypothetical protein
MEDDSGLAILGVIFGIVVLVAWIFTVAKPVWQQETYRNNLVECRYCRAGVPPTAIKCMHCGSKLENYVTYSTPVKTPDVNEKNPGVKNTKIFCTNCEVSIAIYNNQKKIDCWNCKTTNLV